jgi:signal transduction histidine kinase
MFLVSLLVGWFVAGRVLKPIGRITRVARDIQATDMSQRIALEGPQDELRDLADTFDGMLDRIEDAFDAQRRFIQDASHELRNPLAVMRTNLDVVLADENASEEDLRHTAEVVERTAERMSRLVDGLLVSARSEMSGGGKDRFELRTVADETVDEFAATAEAHGIVLSAASNGDATTHGPAVVADRTEIKQALANLVGNAVRLAPSGTAVVVGVGQENGWASLSVADAGPGLTDDEREHVFERFWRGSNQNDADGQRRSGLGLAIVKDIAERHGGRVDVAARPGEGATFVIWLPAAD